MSPSPMHPISIITAVFNGASTLASCLESIEKQSVPVELIIIDGGSTDGTLDIIEKFRPAISHLTSEPDCGVYHAMNKGLHQATGEVIGFLNADDFYPNPQVLKRVIDIFANKREDSCYGDLNYVKADDTSRIVRRWRSGPFTRRSFYWGWMPPHPTFFARRRIYEQHGIFNPDLGSAADYELMLRFLLRHQISTVYIPEVLVHMRTGGISNASMKNRIKANRMDRKAWRVNGLNPCPGTLWLKPFRKIGQFFL